MTSRGSDVGSWWRSEAFTGTGPRRDYAPSKFLALILSYESPRDLLTVRLWRPHEQTPHVLLNGEVEVEALSWAPTVVDLVDEGCPPPGDCLQRFEVARVWRFVMARGQWHLWAFCLGRPRLAPRVANRKGRRPAIPARPMKSVTGVSPRSWPRPSSPSGRAPAPTQLCSSLLRAEAGPHGSEPGF